MTKLWVEREIENIEKREKSQNPYIISTWQYMKIMMFLIPIMLYAMSLSGGQINHFAKTAKHSDGGVFFTCKKCRLAQWQKKDQADWAGKYHCKGCGKEMGKE